MIQIACLTAGDITRASSRLRSFYLFEKSYLYNVSVERVCEFRNLFRYKHIHIQKVFSYKLLFLIILLRILGKNIIFDLDDHSPGFKNFLATYSTLFFCSVLTFDTQPRKRYWSKFLFWKKMHVIPDTADYKSSQFPKLLEIKDLERKILWFGHSSNFESVSNLLKKILSVDPQIEIMIISDNDWSRRWSSQCPEFIFQPWSLDFENFLVSYNGFVILSHNGLFYDKMKSDNKMVMALISGVLPIVSNTDSYLSLATKIKGEKLIFNNYKDILKILDSMTIDEAKSIFHHSHIFIQQNYSKEKVLESFAKIIFK